MPGLGTKAAIIERTLHVVVQVLGQPRPECLESVLSTAPAPQTLTVHSAFSWNQEHNEQ